MPKKLLAILGAAAICLSINISAIAKWQVSVTVNGQAFVGPSGELICICSDTDRNCGPCDDILSLISGMPSQPR
jgi:hypothetical protein